VSESIKGNFTKAVKYVKNLEKKQRNISLLIVGVCLITAVLSVILLNKKEYVLLYRGLDIVECAEISSRLDELGIAHKVQNESAIFVEESSEPSVKLQLASEGFPKSTLNYDVFTQNIDFMTSDYEKTQYSLFQLQDRLQAAIETLDVINKAIVTITLPRDSISVLDADKVEPSASVLLETQDGVVLKAQQIKGIEQLVAKSVRGLSPENISIIDQTGAVLNDNSDEDAASTAEMISMEKQIADIYSDRIRSVLSPIYGDSNISVGVNVVLDYTKKTIQTTDYTPSDANAGVIDSFEQTYTGPITDGVNGGVPGTESNSEIVTYETRNDNEEGDGVISNQVSVKYLVDQVIEQVQKDKAEVKDVTVSVLINHNDIPEETITKLTDVVANATGIGAEKVALYNMEFTDKNSRQDDSPDTTDLPNDDEQDLPDEEGLLSLKNLPILAGAALVSVVLIAGILIILGKRKKKQKIAATRAEESMADIAAKLQAEVDLSKISESREQQLTREIKEFSTKSPQITAMLIRTLLKGESE